MGDFQRIHVATLIRADQNVFRGKVYLHHGVKDRPAVISGHEGPPRDRVYASVTDVDTGVLIAEAMNALPALLALSAAAWELPIGRLIACVEDSYTTGALDSPEMKALELLVECLALFDFEGASDVAA